MVHKLDIYLNNHLFLSVLVRSLRGKSLLNYIRPTKYDCHQSGIPFLIRLTFCLLLIIESMVLALYNFLNDQGFLPLLARSSSD